MNDRSSAPSDESTPASRSAAGTGDKSGAMRDADVANGENPDEQVERSAGTTPGSAPVEAHRTGEAQAQENRENESPA